MAEGTRARQAIADRYARVGSHPGMPVLRHRRNLARRMESSAGRANNLTVEASARSARHHAMNLISRAQGKVDRRSAASLVQTARGRVEARYGIKGAAERAKMLGEEQRRAAAAIKARKSGPRGSTRRRTFSAVETTVVQSVEDPALAVL